MENAIATLIASAIFLAFIFLVGQSIWEWLTGPKGETRGGGASPSSGPTARAAKPAYSAKSRAPAAPPPAAAPQTRTYSEVEALVHAATAGYFDELAARPGGAGGLSEAEINSRGAEAILNRVSDGMGVSREKAAQLIVQEMDSGAMSPGSPLALIYQMAVRGGDESEGGGMSAADEGNVGLDALDLIEPWLPQLQESVGTFVGYIDAIADSDTLRPYRHVPLPRRRAELALFYLWWIDKWVRKQLPDGQKEEAGSAVFQALIADEIPQIDEFGEERFSLFARMEADGQAVNVYAVVPMKAMDSTIEDVDRINSLVVFLAQMTKDLDEIWA